MVLNTKHLNGLPVFTRSKQRVGKVMSFDIDALTGRIAVMRVKASGLVARLSDDELLVSWDAIMEMTEERVIIADNSVQVPASAIASAMNPTPASPTLMREV